MRRVVITGVGAVSPHGLGAEAYWAAVLAGKSSTGTLTRFDPSAFAARVAGQVPAFKTQEFMPKAYRKAVRIMARDIELAVVAADFAVRDAKLATRGVLESSGEKILSDGFFKPDPTRVGCNIGAGMICADLNELTAAMVVARNDDGTLSLAKWGKSEDATKPSGMESLTPLWLLKYLPNMLACHVSIIHDTQGPSNTITCAQASAGLALAEAARTIMRGNADVALVGGCESKVHPMGLMRWTKLDRLTTEHNADPERACRPMDEQASGSVLAEGGAVLVIESLEHAQKRGAKILAEVAGMGATATGVGVRDTEPTGQAMAAAMNKALKDAHIGADAISMMVPPGFGMKATDLAEAAAIKTIFGPRPVPVVPLRGGIGDCGAGVQALDLVGGVLALRDQGIPPAVNCPRPIAGLNVPAGKMNGPVDAVLILASALGGQNSAVILKRFVA